MTNQKQTDILHEKYKKLREILASYGSVAVAFSSGTTEMTVGMPCSRQ